MIVLQGRGETRFYCIDEWEIVTGCDMCGLLGIFVRRPDEAGNRPAKQGSLTDHRHLIFLI